MKNIYRCPSCHSIKISQKDLGGKCPQCFAPLPIDLKPSYKERRNAFNRKEQYLDNQNKTKNNKGAYSIKSDRELFWYLFGFLTLMLLPATFAIGHGVLFSAFQKRFIIIESLHPSRDSELEKQMEAVFGFMGGAGQILWYEIDKSTGIDQKYSLENGNQNEYKVIQKACEGKVAFMHAKYNEPAEISEGDFDRLLSQGAKQFDARKHNVNVTIMRKLWVYKGSSGQKAGFPFNLSGNLSNVDDTSPQNFIAQSESKKDAYCSGSIITLEIPNYKRFFSQFARSSHLGD